MPPLNPLSYLRFLSKIIKKSKVYSDHIEITIFQQISEIYKLLCLNQLEPEEYYDYYLFDSKLSWEEKKKFISYNQIIKLYNHMAPATEEGAFNKVVFYRLMSFHKMPVPRLYGVFHPFSGYVEDGDQLCNYEQLEEFLNNVNTDELIIKPSTALLGHGIMIIKRQGDGSWLKNYLTPISIKEIFDNLIGSKHSHSQSKGKMGKLVKETFLFQEKIRQHSFLDNYSTSCTQTVRIITFYNNEGDVEILGHYLKLGVKNSPTDNVGMYGLGAGLSSDGILQQGIGPRINDIELFDKHPETNFPITGQKIPLLDQVIELAKKGQSLFPQMRLIGWDIAITENGPVIIEANSRWSRYVQVVTRKGILVDSLREELNTLM